MSLVDKILAKTSLSLNKSKVVKNVYWAAIGKVVHVICGLLVGVMLARYLGPEEFGVMNYVVSYVTLFTVFATFGLDGIEIRELSKSNATKDRILGTALILRLCFATATILLILITLWKFESDKYTCAMVVIYSLSLILSSLNVIRNYFTSIILNEYVVKTEITRILVGSLIKVVLLINHCSLTWFIIASTFDFLLVGSGYIYSYRKKVGSIFEWRFDASLAMMLIHNSFPLLLSGAAVIVYQRINAVMIRNMLDNSSVGVFSVAAKITELGVFIPIVIAQTVTPLLVKAHQEDEVRYKAKCKQFMDIMVWSSIAISLAMSIFAAPAIRILYGDAYISAIPVLQIMAWKTVFIGLTSASAQLIIIQGLQQYAVFRNLVGCCVSIGLNYILIPLWGTAGSAVALVVSIAFAGYFSHFAIRPYWHLVPIQTSALFLGWRRGVHLLLMKSRKLRSTEY